jgi:8-oxo-dGTP pyrophosphatase MutT (NUDIX family)
MPLDQASSSTLTNLAHSFLRFLGEEATEGHHPPNAGQHQQMLGQGSADVNEQPGYPSGGAGMLLMAPDGRALFVRRAANARDHAGMWSIPGGMTEGDEEPWQTAARETHEETGARPNNIQLLDHTMTGDFGFTTFGGKVGDNFRPVLNDEHDGYQWANLDQAPQPLHPGLKSTLDFAMDPLTEKGSKIMKSMKSQYGPEKGERVFYASRNKGTISGVDDLPGFVTTGRQDTQIPRPHPVNPRIDNPFNANVDAWRSPSQVDQMVTSPSSAPPASMRSAQGSTDTWRSPSQLDAGTSEGARKAAQTRQQAGGGSASRVVNPGFARRNVGAPERAAARRAQHEGERRSERGPPSSSRDAWRSPSQDDQAGTTAHKAMKPAASKPLAGTAGSRQLTPSRYARRSHDAGGGAGGWGHKGLTPPTQSGANDYGGRFVLRDKRTGTDYAIDQPISAAFQPMVTGADEKPAKDSWRAAGADPTAPAGESMVNPPPLPGAGGGMRGGTSQQMPGSPMQAVGGPKYTQTYKVESPDGTVDERKITRVGSPIGGAQQEWQSPSQSDGGWPNAATLGPSAMGGGRTRV